MCDKIGVERYSSIFLDAECDVPNRLLNCSCSVGVTKSRLCKRSDLETEMTGNRRNTKSNKEVLKMIKYIGKNLMWTIVRILGISFIIMAVAHFVGFIPRAILMAIG